MIETILPQDYERLKLLGARATRIKEEMECLVAEAADLLEARYPAQRSKVFEFIRYPGMSSADTLLKRLGIRKQE